MTTTSCSGVPSVFCAVIQERKAGRAVDGSLALYPYKDRIRVRIRSWIRLWSREKVMSSMVLPVLFDTKWVHNTSASGSPVCR